ncbi:MAG TPA: AmmeMemoRadiSam system protein A [Bacillota bacterium]|nr:AmmeMemoRadiSam system protein A [Bacillota bacterium]
MLLMGALTPHPPIILPEIGHDSTKEVEATSKAFQRLGEEIRQLEPETVVIFSPHGPVFQDGMGIRGGERLAGDLSQFGAKQRWQWPNDRELAEAIAEEAVAEGIYTMVLSEDTRRYDVNPALDHGVLVPMSMLNLPNVSLVAMGMAFLPREELYAFGKAVAQAIEKTGRRTVVIASGDLSHCLKPGAPSPYHPKGEEFDQTLVGLIREGRLREILSMDPDLVEKGAECGYRTILMLLGVMDARNVEAKLLSYEGPFGVGYAIASFHPGQLGSSGSLLADMMKARSEAVTKRRAAESPFVRLARLTVESRVKGTDAPGGDNLPEAADKRAGVFVSIKKHGELRGCIGTIEPVQKNVESEIRANAVSAAFRDPRFNPIDEDELDDLVYSVDLLNPPEPIDDISDLDPNRYGVIVSRGGRSGLLLPNLEGIDSAEEQVAIAKRKAGIATDEDVDLQRFTVERYY